MLKAGCHEVEGRRLQPPKPKASLWRMSSSKPYHYDGVSCCVLAQLEIIRALTASAGVAAVQNDESRHATARVCH
jgi:hypothetical protein